MDLVRSREPDFEARIRILTAEEGGRDRPIFNGIRWDYGYPEDDISETGIYMIWPYFYDQDGQAIPENWPLIGSHTAHMFICNREMVPFHKKRIAVGSEFHCHEGSKIVANGVVTKLLGLGV